MDTLAALNAAVRANVPVMLIGPPGIGKTARIRKITEQLGWPIYEVIASIREPSDFGGYPVPVNSHVRLVPSGEWQDFAAKVEEAGAGVLFLDEVADCAPAIQAALMRVVLDKCVGELHLPSATRIVCATNPTSLAAGGWDLAAPLANRLMHLQWPEPSIDDWTQWLLVESVHESEERRWRGAQGQRVRALLAGFMHVRGSLLLDVPKDEESRGRAWPSPRSWAMCARALSEVVDAHPAELPLDMLGLVAASAVGAGAGGELVAWARDADLPDPEVILEDPKKWHVDLTRQDRVWAVLGSVYGAVMGALDTKGKMPEKRWRAAWRVFAHADKSGATAAATAALAIPLAHAAVPGGPAADLKQPEEVRVAVAMRMAALGLEAQG